MAVRDASLELERGEFVSIVGRSGSGKSTLMAMLGALTPPTQGKVLLDGADIWALPEAGRAIVRSRHIGFVFQFPSLLSNLTAVDNVAVPALLGRTMDAQAAYARAYDLLARVGLAERADAYPGSMSGGEQRRACGRPRADQFAAAVARRRADQRPRRRHRSRHHRPARSVAAHRGVRPGARHPRSTARQACAAQLRDAAGRAARRPTCRRSRSRRSAGRGTSGRPRLAALRSRQSRPRRARRSGWAATCGRACRPFC